ncbi:MAG: hypothetical protein ACLRIS_04100 [Flavonifractor plautii]
MGLLRRRQAAGAEGACADHNGLGITYSIGLEAKYDLASDDPAGAGERHPPCHPHPGEHAQGGGGHPQRRVLRRVAGPARPRNHPWTRSAARRSLPWSPCPGS